jgi:hypothetical protein
MPSALARIQFRFGPASDWTAANPVLLEGEPGFEGDTGKVKVGDGIRHWVALPYLGSGSGGSSPVTSVNAKTGDVILIPEDVPGLPAFIKSVIASTLVAGPNVGITSNTALGTVTIAAAGGGGGGGGSGSGVISINGKTGGVTVDGRDGITVTQEASVPTIHIGVTTGGSYGGTPALPSAPTSVVGVPADSLVVVSWQEPHSSGTSDITDYVVQYSSDYGATWVTFADGTDVALSATVTALENGTDYVFRVAAVNASGRGAYSAQSAAVRPFVASSPLTGVTLTGTSVASGALAGTVVGTLAPVPPSIAGVVYSLPSTTPGNESFVIDGNQLRLAGPLDSTVTPSVLISVAASPATGSPVASDFTITVQPAAGIANVISITQQPIPATAAAGAASFSVVAASSVNAPLSYQWQVKPAASTSWDDVPGATADTLSLTHLTYASNNATKYRVVISSANANSVTSSEVCLSVPPEGWQVGSGLGDASKIFPVENGIMVATDTELYWTSDGSQHERKTPDFSVNAGWLTAAGWPGLGVRAAMTWSSAQEHGHYELWYSNPDWKYSSDLGVAWSPAPSPLPSGAGHAQRISEWIQAGPAGFTTNVYFDYDFTAAAPLGAFYAHYSLDGLLWRRTPRIPDAIARTIPALPSRDGRPGAPTGVQLTNTKFILRTASAILSLTLRPAPATAWATHAIPAPIRPVLARCPNMIEVAGSLWWFGTGSTYLSCTTDFTGWAEHPLPFTDNYVAVAAGAGMIVAVGSSRAAVCSDPASHAWVAEPIGITNPFGVAFANNKFFVYSSTKSSVREALPAGAIVGCGVPGAVPSEPQQLSVTTGDGSAVLSWQPPASSGTAPVTGYAMQYRTSPSGAWSSAASVSDLVANVAGLANGSAYEFRVCAVNSEGQGPFASVTDTPHGPPAQAPTGVTAVGVAPDVTALDSTLTSLSVNGGYSWRHGDHTRFSVSWTPPAEGPTPLRYIVEMKSIHLGESGGFPWRRPGYADPFFDVEYTGTTAVVRALYNIYTPYTAAVLWNRNLLWSFRVAGVTGDGPGAWSNWSAPTSLMPAPASSPSGGTTTPPPVLPAPIVTASASEKRKACYPYAGSTRGLWYDVFTLSWPAVAGGAVTRMRLQMYHPAGTVLGVRFTAGWGSDIDERLSSYPDASVAGRAHVSFKKLSDTSAELWLLQRNTPCPQTSVANGGAFTAAYGATRTFRVILATSAGITSGGEVTITTP